MDETLGRRVHREFCWFALLLLLLVIACVDRVGSGTLPSTRAANAQLSSDAAR
jgi:uncharacterized membrane protein